MTQLTGSDKQVTWAEGIREKALTELSIAMAHLDWKVTRLRAKGSLPSNADSILDRLPGLVSAIRAHTQASWWIDHRDSQWGLRPLILAAMLEGIEDEDARDQIIDEVDAVFDLIYPEGTPDFIRGCGLAWSREVSTAIHDAATQYREAWEVS